jgi:hypothetical protein
MRLAVSLALLSIVGPAFAGTVSETTARSVALDAGQALEWQFGVSNFGLYSASPLPSRIAFQFNTAQFADPTGYAFDASLQSLDGSQVFDLGTPLEFSQGLLATGKSKTPLKISSVGAAFALSADDAASLFGESGKTPALLVLRNIGAPLTVGLSGYTIAQTSAISVAGGGLSMGATVGAVWLDTPTITIPMNGTADNTDVPEPGTLTLIAIGLAAGAGARWLKRA